MTTMLKPGDARRESLDEDELSLVESALEFYLEALEGHGDSSDEKRVRGLLERLDQMRVKAEGPRE